MARLFRPAGAGPHPAIVALHGCSGLRNLRGVILPIYRAWAAELTRNGFVVLLVDSGTPRGIGPACVEGPERRTMHMERLKDAYAALGFLQAQPDVQADRIGVMGWSPGGGAVLNAIPETSLGRPTPPPAHDFRAAIALYPALCGARAQPLLRPDMPSRSWTTRIPLMVLFGEADNWTPLPPCRDFMADARARGAPVEFHAYPEAHHAFDAPNLPPRELPAYRTQRGIVPIIATTRPRGRTRLGERWVLRQASEGLNSGGCEMFLICSHNSDMKFQPCSPGASTGDAFGGAGCGPAGLGSSLGLPGVPNAAPSTLRSQGRFAC